MDLETLLVLNQHWDGERYNYPVERKILRKVWGYLEYPLVVLLRGPRRVGKTVILRQIINKMLDLGVPAKHILYFSYDEAYVEPLRLIRMWEQIISKKVRGSGYCLILDEIGFLKDWQSKVKLLYDHLGIKVILSGSAFSTDISSLAGRIVEIFVPPLSYSEFAMFRGLRECTFSHYLKYMSRQLPFLALYGVEPKEYVSSIVEKSIFVDAARVFGIHETDVMHSIFRTISRWPGQILVIEDLAKDFGISRNTASRILRFLEKIYLVRKLYNFSTNPRKSERKAKKYYPFYTTLHSYTNTFELEKIAETEVAFQLGAEFFYNEKGREVDFVLCDGKVGVEVKMRKRIERKHIRTLERFEEKYVVTYPSVSVPFGRAISFCDLENLHSKLCKFGEN